MHHQAALRPLEGIFPSDLSLPCAIQLSQQVMCGECIAKLQHTVSLASSSPAGPKQASFHFPAQLPRGWGFMETTSASLAWGFWINPVSLWELPILPLPIQELSVLYFLGIALVLVTCTLRYGLGMRSSQQMTHRYNPYDFLLCPWWFRLVA